MMGLTSALFRRIGLNHLGKAVLAVRAALREKASRPREAPCAAVATAQSEAPPRARSGNFAKDGAATIVVTMMTLVLGLLTGLIVARILGPEGRGALTAVLTAPQLLGWLFGMGCGKAVTFFLSRDPTIGGKLLTSWLAILVPVGLLAVPLSWLLLPTLLSAQPDETLAIAQLYAPVILLSLLTELALGLILGDQDFRSYNLLRLMQPAGTAIAYASLWQAGWFTVATAVIAQAGMSLLVFVLAMLVCVHRHGIGRPDLALGRRSLWYALRVHGGVISGVVTQRFDLMIMPAFLTASSVGLYAVSTNIAWIVMSVSGSLAMIVMPAAIQRGVAGRELVMRCVHATFILGGLLGGGLFLFAEPAIGLVYGGAFLESVLPLRILLPGVVLYAAANILYNGLYTENRPMAATFAQSVGLVATVVGLFVFLPSGGILAAAITSTVAYSCVFVTAAILYRRATKLDWVAFRPAPADIRSILQAAFQRFQPLLVRFHAAAPGTSATRSTGHEGKHKMRISLMTPEYPPGKRLGGIAVDTHRMARALARAGHDVQVVAPGDPGTHCDDGVTVVRVGIGRRLHPLVDRFRINRRFAKAALTWRPDVVHAAEFDANAWWLARFSSVPVVTRLATPSGMVKDIGGRPWVPHSRLLDFSLLDFMERDQTRRSAVVYAPSKAISNRIGRNWGIAPEAIHVIPNLPGPGAVRRGDAFRPDRPLPDRFIVVFGRPEDRRGIAPLAQALPAVLAAHPDVHAVIVGGGDPESAEAIATFDADLAPVADRVHLLGDMPREDALAIVARAEISVVPSLWEDFGFVVLEALALGVPVVATECGGNPEIIQVGRSGRLVPPGDGEALRNELLGRLADREALSTARRDARRRADEFDSDSVALRVSSLLKRACATLMPAVLGASQAVSIT